MEPTTNKSNKRIIIIALVAVLMAAAFFMAANSTYNNVKNRFPKGLVANGLDIGTMTIEEASLLLSSETKYPLITIKDHDTSSNAYVREYDLQFDESHISYDYTKALSDYADKLPSFVTAPGMEIIAHLQGVNESITLNPETTINKDNLKETFYNIDFVASSIGTEDKHEISIVPDKDSGFILKNTKENILDKDAAFSLLCLSAIKKDAEVDISSCRKDMDSTPKEKETLKLWDTINTYSNNRLTYQNGNDTITIEKKELLDFLDTKNGIPGYSEPENENTPKETDPKAGQSDAKATKSEAEPEKYLAISEEAVDKFLKNLSVQIDNTDVSSFTLPDYAKGKAVKEGLYAIMLNRESEKKFLMNFLGACTGENQDYLSKLEEIKNKDESDLTDIKVEKTSDGSLNIKRTPSCFYRADLSYRKELGDTYIEINLSDQHMYLYHEGKLFLDTDIVSGTGGRTPGGRYKIYSKERNRYLTGPTWRAYVNFWMPFNGNIGIHDANWRSAYGGSIYLSNGSHGCVNTPYENMAKIFEKVKIGTPVVCYY